MVATKETGHHASKLVKILSMQLFFAILFGALAYLFFYIIAAKIITIISVILPPLENFQGHELNAVILALLGFIMASFLAVYTVGQHYHLKKQFSTIIVGMLATSALAIILLLVVGQSFLVPILLLSLLVALFGYHSNTSTSRK